MHAAAPHQTRRLGPQSGVLQAQLSWQAGMASPSKAISIEPGSGVHNLWVVRYYPHAFAANSTKPSKQSTNWFMLLRRPAPSCISFCVCFNAQTLEKFPCPNPAPPHLHTHIRTLTTSQASSIAEDCRRSSPLSSALVPSVIRTIAWCNICTSSCR